MTCATPLWAQPAGPQPFLAPPQLAQRAPTTGALLAVAPPTGCQANGDVTREGHLVTMHLTAEIKPNTIYNPSTGVADNVSLRSYGGCMTGPLIDVRPGDTVRIFLHNDLPANDPSCPPTDGNAFGCFNTINLHFHGLHVSPAGNSDNVLLNIVPQTRFEYEVNIPADHPSGTFWYHAHRHGSTAIQVASGASGALIVRGDRPYVGGPPGDIDTILHDATGRPMREQIFLFQQIPYACMVGNPPHPNQKSDGTWVCDKGQIGTVDDFDQQLGGPSIWDNSGRFTSINGAVQPTISGAINPALKVTSGEIQRWRFIHGGIHDTVNLEIVPMVASGPRAALALSRGLVGTPKQQAATLSKLCPTTMPDGSKPVDLVPQFEVATDGITRNKIVEIGAKQDIGTIGVGTNFLQPGYRSDILIVFPHAGTYCMLNEAAPADERPNPNTGGGGQGPNTTQLLATIVVDPGVTVPQDQLRAYVLNALQTSNQKDEPPLPADTLKALGQGDLTPWRGMPEEGPAINSAHPRQVNFYLGNDPKNNFGFWINGQMYDPDRIDASMTMQVNTTEDWLLTSAQPAGWGAGCCSPAPHIYHIHVNPFEIMDVTYNGKSIFGPNGECLLPADKFGLESQYCNLWHTFKDTIFVQNGYEVHMRTTYDRYIGEYVLHCHILDHEDSGMMENVLIVPDASQPNGGLGMPGMKTMSNGTMTRTMTH